MTDGLNKILVFHLPGTGGTILDAGKTDNALPPVGGNRAVKGNRFRRTRFRALAALDTGIFIRFRSEGNGFSRFLIRLRFLGNTYGTFPGTFERVASSVDSETSSFFRIWAPKACALLRSLASGRASAMGRSGVE